MQLLRFLTCGSVDDGKSTLVGRLLHECGSIPDDELRRLERESRAFGTQEGGLDFALLVDGLEAEREQAITIDVAYRYFATERRRFIVADAPGHEQYTRNFVTAASTADLALLLADAREGLLTQTRRHCYLAKLLGIGSVVLAVNKMDLVGFGRNRFEAIAADFADFAEKIGLPPQVAIPVCATRGDNVRERSRAMGWYDGPTLVALLEGAVPAGEDGATGPLRMPVQLVSRPDESFRGYCGTIAAGMARPGDPVRILPSGRMSAIDRIVTVGGDLAFAAPGQAVTLSLRDPVDCARGDVIAAADDPPEAADQFEATIVWMGDEPLLPGRHYVLKLASQTVVATVQPPKYRVDPDSLEHLAAATLSLNEIGVANLWTNRPLVFEPYALSRALGGFILVDKTSNATVSAGLLHFALRRSQNVHGQPLDITPEARAAIKGQQPRILWFTGLSGAGKSTIANLVERKLHALGRHTFLLDGDNLRLGLTRDLGFTEADRVENIRRVAEAARLMADAGLIVLVALISPFRAERDAVRAMFPDGMFVEIFIDTPLAEAERRDPKGLYKKARAGRLANFTGIDAPYEPPEAPEIRIDTLTRSPAAAADEIVAHLLGPSGLLDFTTAPL